MERIIIDTDLGFDCDDAGTLALANFFIKNEKVKILAITHCVNRQIGGVAIKSINEYYGNADIPVGIATKYPINVDNFYEEFYAKMQFNPNFKGFSEKPSFDKMLNEVFQAKDLSTAFPDSKNLIIEKLKHEEDKSVTFLCVGQLNNLAMIISDETAFSLFKSKIKKIVIMGGNFEQYEEYYDDGEILWNGEFNIILDIVSAKKVVQSNKIPLFFMDFNQGVDILTGSGLSGQNDNPVYAMYNIHGKGKECPSWDLCAFLFASGLYDDYFEISNNGKVEISDKGKTSFIEGKGIHRIVRIKDDCKKIIKNEINDILSKGKYE